MLKLCTIYLLELPSVALQVCANMDHRIELLSEKTTICLRDNRIQIVIQRNGACETYGSIRSFFLPTKRRHFD